MSAGQGERPLLAVGLMLAGMALIPVGDGFNKAAAGASGHAPVALAWWRFAVGLCLVAPVALWRAASWAPDRGFLMAAALRGGIIAGSITCITTALTRVPLAEVFAAFFVGPFVAVLLAWAVAGERVGRRDWAAIALGFAGVLAVVRPGLGMTPGIGWAVAAGVGYGGYIVATRMTAPLGHPLSHLAGQLAVAGLVTLPFALADPAGLAPQVPGLLLGSGAASAAGNLLAITALGLGATALLAPLIYTQLLSAVVVGVVVFGEAVGPATAAGMAAIAVAGGIQATGRD